MIHKVGQDGKAEGKNDDSRFFTYCMFFGKVQIYVRLHNYLYDIEDHIYGHILESIDICSSIMLISHKLSVYFVSHICKESQHLQNTYKGHSGKNFCTYDRKLVLYRKCYCTQGQLFHIQLAVSMMFSHKGKAEADYIWRDTFCKVLNDRLIHISVFHN